MPSPTSAKWKTIVFASVLALAENSRHWHLVRVSSLLLHPQSLAVTPGQAPTVAAGTLLASTALEYGSPATREPSDTVALDDVDLATNLRDAREKVEANMILQVLGSRTIVQVRGTRPITVEEAAKKLSEFSSKQEMVKSMAPDVLFQLEQVTKGLHNELSRLH